jgi:hypothetical protein
VVSDTAGLYLKPASTGLKSTNKHLLDRHPVASVRYQHEQIPCSKDEDILTKSVPYGVGIEMNVIEHRKRVDATVYLTDGDSYRTKLERSEQPGKWFHPLVATLVTGGGRLLLAAAMHQIEQAGCVSLSANVR